MSKGGHRGGYTYRLCKLPAEGKTGLTEECFAQNVLEWATDYTMMRETGRRNLGKWDKFRQTDLRFVPPASWQHAVLFDPQGRNLP